MVKNDPMFRLEASLKRFLGVNMLWYLFSLPFFLVFFLMDWRENILLRIALAMVAVFLLFPATSALFGVVRQYVMRKEVPVFQSFLTYYKENYQRSWIGGIFFLILWGLFFSLYDMYVGTNVLVQLLFLAAAIFLICFMGFFFSMTVHMEVSLHAVFQNAVVLTIGGNLLTLLIGLLLLALVYISFSFFPFLLIILTGSLMAHLSFWAFYKLMGSVQYYKKQSSSIEEE